MPIRSAQSVLNQYYAVRDDLLAGKIASYSIGDKNITLQNMQDLEEIIQQYEAVVVASETGVVLADLTGAANVSGVQFRQTNYP
jgi:hypothetical protein